MALPRGLGLQHDCYGPVRPPLSLCRPVSSTAFSLLNGQYIVQHGRSQLLCLADGRLLVPKVRTEV
jgi:hypothetical protein